MSEIGDRIKKLRQSLGLKQVKFCQMARVSQGFLAEVETGKKQPSSRVLLAISQVCGVDEGWLRTGKGKQKSEGILLNKEEREVVTLYRRLRPNDQADLVKRLKSAV